MIGVCVLGSTGSIGENTLDLIARHSADYSVIALGAHRNVEKLLQQCERFRPQHVALADRTAARMLATELKSRGLAIEVHAGPEGLSEIAAVDPVDCVIAGIVGAAGLHSTFAAARAGKRLLLANKEPLVMAGRMLIEVARRHGAMLLPVDSEHNAIFQCLPADFVPGEMPRGVRRILLTASGGPFIDASREQLEQATVDQACRHPNWVMGRKISVDSATLMNKGLEVIEASVLFGVDVERIEVLVHPQSVVHSMVEYEDGSVLAQLGTPDMRTPIAHALAWPRRIASGVTPLDLLRTSQLQFRPPDTRRFPALRLAREAAQLGGSAPAVLNAANEVAVAAFLERQLNFMDIPRVIESVMDEHARDPFAPTDLDAVLQADQRARAAAELVIRSGRSLAKSGTNSTSVGVS